METTLDAALLAPLPPAVRSVGQVTVADWKAIGFSAFESASAGLISSVLRYFSIRRRETKP